MDKIHNLYIVTHGKSQYVAGLNWEVITPQSARRSRRQAKEDGADHYLVWRQPDTVLLGMTLLSAFRETSARDRQTYRSLALHVLPHLPANGYVVTALSDKVWWFVATIEGRLSPLSDIVGSPEQIKQVINVFVMMNPLPSAGWQVIAPESFGLENSQTPPPLSRWLTHDTVHKTPRLLPTNARTIAVFWVLLLLAFIAGYFGWQHWQQRQQDAEIAAAHAAVAARRAELRNENGHRPWGDQPPFNAVLRACHNRWKVLPLSIAGWTFAQAQCTQDGNLSVQYVLPEGGTVADFAGRLPHWYPGTVAGFNIPGGADIASFTLTFTPPRPSPAENIPDNATQTQRFTSFAQRLSAALQLVKQDNALRDDDGNIIEVPWNTYAFTFVTDIPPDQLFLAQHFDDTGLRLQQISLTQRDGHLTYTLEGSLYATK